MRTAWNKGKHLSDVHKLSLSIAHKGQTAWMKGKSPSAEHRRKLSESLKRLKVSPATLARRFSNLPKGELHWNWQGGKTPKHKAFRRSNEYMQWRKHVFNRDDYTCQACGKRGVKLQADHELSFAEYPDLRQENPKFWG